MRQALRLLPPVALFLHFSPSPAMAEDCSTVENAVGMLKAAPVADPLGSRVLLMRETSPAKRVDRAFQIAEDATPSLEHAQTVRNAFPSRCTTRTRLEDAYKGLRTRQELIQGALTELANSGASIDYINDVKGRLLRTNDLLGGAATALAVMEAQYGLYVGPSFSLAGDGSWKNGVEVLGRFEPAAGTPEDSPTCFRPFVWCRAYSEFSYQVIGAVDDEAAEGAGEEPPGETAEPLLNPFQESGGYFRFNGGVRAHISEWIGVRAGIGLSSIPKGGTDVTQLEDRRFVGLDFQTIYDDGAMGQMFIGYAYDEFWQREAFNDPEDPTAGTHIERDFERWIVDGVFLVPNIEAVGFRVATRLYADAPISGEGPSEVRASILFYHDFSDWLGLFAPLKGQPRTPGL